MTISVGIDIGKAFHWACAVNEQGAVLLNRKVLNTPEDLLTLSAELRALPAPVCIGLDVLGGIAALTQAVLLEAGFNLVHLPGLAVKRARESRVGGASKRDRKDARIIADQVRTRTDNQVVMAESDLNVELRLLVSRRSDLTQEQTRRLERMHDLLISIFPELDAALDLTNKTALYLLTRFVTPTEFRRVKERRLMKYLGTLAVYARDLVPKALECAQRQRIVVPGEQLTANLIKELAQEALEVRERLKQLDTEIEARLARRPEAALVRTLPGRGATLTAAFLVQAGSLERFKSADKLAAAAGLAPVLKQSGKSCVLQRARGGNKQLKCIFYQSAFASLKCPDSRRFYDRKKQEGKPHHQALIALAKRRVNVLWAMLRDQQPFIPKNHFAMA